MLSLQQPVTSGQCEHKHAVQGLLLLLVASCCVMRLRVKGQRLVCDKQDSREHFNLQDRTNRSYLTGGKQVRGDGAGVISHRNISVCYNTTIRWCHCGCLPGKRFYRCIVLFLWLLTGRNVHLITRLDHIIYNLIPNKMETSCLHTYLRISNKAHL